MAKKPVPDDHSATLRLGRYGTARGALRFSAKSFRDVDVLHPQGRQCTRLTFVVQGVETVQCTEIVIDLYEAEMQQLRDVLQLSPMPGGSVFASAQVRG